MLPFPDYDDINRHIQSTIIQAHNLKVVGSNPTPATNYINTLAALSGGSFFVREGFAKQLPEHQKNLTVI